MDPLCDGREHKMKHLRIGFAFLTRLPMGDLGTVADGALARAAVTFPIVGAVVGGLAGLVLWGSHSIGMPPILSAGLGVGTMILLTGALHEDGLADTADGLGLARDPARALDIMRDSRIGTFGVLALLFSVGLRWAAVALLIETSVLLGVFAVAASAALSRAYLPTMMAALPPARDDGLGHSAGVADKFQAIIALVLGIAVVGALFDRHVVVAVIISSAVVILLFSAFVRSRLGGQTGDILGAAQQLSEMAALLAIVAATGGGA